MIQVIEKVSEILAFLAERRDQEVVLSELADSLKINRATCANIMKSLKELDLVQQADYRGGYILGSQIYNLAGIRADNTSIKARLKPIIDALNREVNENVILAVIRNGRRDLLYVALGNNRIEAKVIYTMGIWPATTAKVIAAHYDTKKLNELVKQIGLPGDDWPEARTKEGLLKELEKIRQKDVITVINQHFACIVAPVFKGQEIVASLGMYLPDIRLYDGRQELLENKLLETARKCSSVLQ